MLKNKIAAAGMAGMLAMSLGLAACGGNNSAASATSAEATSAEATSAAADATSAAADSAATTSAADATAAADSAVYYEGTLADGSEVTYAEDVELQTTTLMINSADLSDIKMWIGTAAADGEKFTITDMTSNETISYTIDEVSADASAVTLTIDGYGQVQLKGVTQAEYDAQLQEALELLDNISALADEATSAAAAE